MLFRSQGILNRVEQILKDGATIIDIGGYSSRPGAENVTIKDELKRVTNSVSLIRKEFPESIISIDTFRSKVAKVALSEGANIINDISGGELDSNMFELVAKSKAPYIIMHMRGNPQTMANLTDYDNVVQDVVDYFIDKINHLTNIGVADIIIDPGFGFAKTVEQNFEILNKLKYLRVFKLPLLAGVSRKSMINRVLNTTPDMALNGTTVLNTIALMNGAQILRVHDVKEAYECIKLYKATYP